MRFPALIAFAVTLSPACLAEPILLSPRPLLVVAGQPDDARYRRPPGRGFDGIGSLFFERLNGGVSCTGSLLETGRHVLTAAHCVTNSSGIVDSIFGEARFELPDGGEERIPASRYAVHPDWTGDLRAGNDLAVMTLAVTASPQIQRYEIYSETDELSQTAELIGFGATGTGATGYLFDDGLRRGGRNRLDTTFVNTFDRFPGWTAGAKAILIDFDDGSAAHNALASFGFADRGAGLDEVMPAPGDSGAPVLLSGRIAAVASFATRLVDADGTTPDVDSELNRSFGEVSGLTRVSEYEDWISATAAVPEPSLAIPVCLTLIVLGCIRRRR